MESCSPVSISQTPNLPTCEVSYNFDTVVFNSAFRKLGKWLMQRMEIWNRASKRLYRFEANWLRLVICVVQRPTRRLGPGHKLFIRPFTAFPSPNESSNTAMSSSLHLTLDCWYLSGATVGAITYSWEYRSAPFGRTEMRDDRHFEAVQFYNRRSSPAHYGLLTSKAYHGKCFILVLYV